MISVMMMSNNNNNNNDSKGFELNRRNDAVQNEEANNPRVSINGQDEKLSSKSNSSLVVEFRSSDDARVSKGVDEKMDFPVCEIKTDDEKSNINENELADFDRGKNEMDDKGKVLEMIKKEVKLQNGKMGHKKPTVSDYNSMLSMFDEFARNGKPWAVGYGFEIGDMVWGKVKSHPWWPGHIYNDAFASPSVRRSKTEGHVLVAFFGDSSYGWFDPADELIPFEPNFAEKSKQTNARNFVKAVEEAIDEASRRSGLGLACRCRNPYNFRPTSVDGFFAVDVGDYEPGGIFSASQIKKARDSFQPWEMLAFVKKLALIPRTDGYGSINFIKHKAAVLAYRKAVFEEFDETYAQAFGAQPVRPEPRTAADQPPREPSRAPLSGRLVMAEALGKGKASEKPNRAKDRVEKDRYLFKRRDEANELKSQKATKGQPGSSSQPIQIDGNSISVQGTYPSVLDQMNDTIGSNVAEAFEHPLNQSAPVEESRGLSVNHSGAGETKLQAEGSRTHTEVGRKKVKVHKRPAGELSSEDSVPSEKKNKKKREIGAEMSSDRMQMQAVAGKVGAMMAKVAGKLVQVPLAAEGESKVNYQMKDVAGKLVQVPSATEGDSKTGNQKGDDAASASMLPDSVEMRRTVSNSEAELRQLLSDLQALALNPFHGLKRSCPLTIQKVFLKFRSLVYQKSLASLLPTESEASEAHTSKSPANAAVSDNPPVEHVKEMSSLKPEKLSSRPEDPTIGGRKRGPSGRQEEMAAKKKKKINDLKSMTIEKKAAQKAPEAPRGNANALHVKPTAPTPTKAVRPEAGKRTGMVMKAADPTMLIMKFPPGGALPSLAELKVKFARFGPLDQSKIRVYWQSSQCRLVYQHKSHAQEALKFATGSNNLFGNTNVRCYLRDLAVETPESESTKVQREDASVGASQSREPGVEQRQAAKLASQPPQQQLQLKSCLRKPSGDEGGTINGGNGGGRGARVKFMLGGEESNRTEQLTVGNRNFNNNASFADGGASSSSHAMDFNSKNFQKVITPPQLSILPLSPAQFPKAPNNVHYNEFVPRNVPNFNTPPAPAMPSTINIDIAQQMLSLLTKCNDVVNNLTGLFGYVPYHPL